MRYIERCILIFISRSIANCVPARLESGMTLLCAIECGSADKERRCRRVAVAGCADCELQGALFAAKECCGETLCEYSTTTT